MTSIADRPDTHTRPGQIRDAVVAVLAQSPDPVLSVAEIEVLVSRALGHRVTPSSVRSFLNLNVPRVVIRVDRGRYGLASRVDDLYSPKVTFGRAQLYQDDAFAWLARQPENSVHAVVTDPPYGVVEYSAKEQLKLRAKKGGVWRIPPTFDGVQRSPLPRFTTLSRDDLELVDDFFREFATALVRVLAPGANVFVASNPLVSHIVAGALADGGLERRGEIIRLVQTLRGGDRPKGAHVEFPDVSVMPRSQWEPWLLFRKPLNGTVAENLRIWGTGGFRRISGRQPFGDVIRSAPTHATEKRIAPHPSLKPQAFLRQIVRASLPLGRGVVLDPFAGSGSTLAAAEAVGYASMGVERDPEFVQLAGSAVERLSHLVVRVNQESILDD